MDIDPIPRIDTLKEAQELADAGIDPKAAKALVSMLDRSLRAGTISRAEREIFDAKIAKSEKTMTVLTLITVGCLAGLIGAAAQMDWLVTLFN